MKWKIRIWLPGNELMTYVNCHLLHAGQCLSFKTEAGVEISTNVPYVIEPEEKK